MKKILIPLLLISLIFTGCAKKSEKPVDNEKDGIDTMEEVSKEEAIYIKAEEVMVRDFQEKLTLSGTLKPKGKVTIKSKVSGEVKDIFIDIGSKVNKDDKLSKIDDTIYKIKYEQADIEVKRSNIDLNKLKVFSSGLKDQSIEIAEKEYRTALINYETTKKDYERKKQLHNEKIISDSDLEKIEQNYKIIEESLAHAKRNLEHTKRDYQYNVKSEEINKLSNVATFKLAKEDLDATDITASISGIVAEKYISIGESVVQGTELFTVVNSDEMYIETGVSERDVINVKKGQKAFVKVGALKKAIEGRVVSVSPILDEQSKTYKTKVIVKNVDDILKGGMFATVELIVGDQRTGLAVPKASVVSKGGERFIYLIDKDRAKKAEVTIGYTNEKYYEIVKGIKKGDKVITTFNDKIKDGSLIKLK
ncbi:efflux RND transporter periplasmic adaptor subunit [Wukongibacter baidiensis]|uniref:efflux RND transporter periplasmic adaptor subunit n=1 Tax=Wukongibacter baidiensis TaxID=1723361 RepID=UPI003D7FA9CD